MPSNNDITISKFVFWFITAVFTLGIAGLGTWGYNMSGKVVDGQIAQAKMQGLVISLDARLQDTPKIGDRIHELESKIRELTQQSNANTNDLYSRKGLRFNMPDYDNYIRPIQSDLLERVTILETKVNQ
jgi:hypothetical protein